MILVNQKICQINEYENCILIYSINLISSPTIKLNRDLNKQTIKYKIGVSNNATRTLNKKPFNNRIENKSHSITPKEHNKNRTENVSKNWEVIVEKLLRNQRCLALVNLFQ